MPAGVSLLQVFDELSGVKRNILLNDEILRGEVSNIFESVFPHGKSVIGIRDPASGVVYPLSLLSQVELPSSTVYRTVLTRTEHLPEGKLRRSESLQNLRTATQNDDEPSFIELHDLNEEDILLLKEQHERAHGPIDYVEFLSLLVSAIDKRSSRALPTPDDSSDEEEDEEDEKDEEDEEDEEDEDERQIDVAGLEENVEEIQLVTGLDQVSSLESLLDLLPAHFSSNTGRSLPQFVNREGFVEMMLLLRSLAPSDSHAGADTPEQELEHIAAMIFDVLVTPSDEYPAPLEAGYADQSFDLAPLASGLCLLSGGSFKKNLRFVFSLYEEKDLQTGMGIAHLGDGTPSVPDCCVYLHLCTVFRLVYQLCGRPVRESAPVSAEELAYRVSIRVLCACPRRFSQGVVTMPEFVLCCIKGLQEAIIVLRGGAGADSLLTLPVIAPPPLPFPSSHTKPSQYEGEDEDQYEEDEEDEEEESRGVSGALVQLEDSLVAASLVDYEGGPLSLSRSTALLGLLRFSPDEVFTAVKYAANEDAELSYASYQRLMGQLVGKQYAMLSVLDRAVVDHVIAQLYAVYDSGVHSAIDASNVCWALLLFCGGGSEAKARTASDVLQFFKETEDQNRDVSAEEMALCLTSMLKAVRGLDATFLSPMSPYDVAMQISMNAFSTAGVQWQRSGHQGLGSDVRKKLLDEVSFSLWFSVLLEQFYEHSGVGLSAASDSSFESKSQRSSYAPSNSTFSIDSSLNSADRWERRVFGDSPPDSPTRSSVAMSEESSSYAPAPQQRSRKPPLTIDTDFTEELEGTDEDDDNSFEYGDDDEDEDDYEDEGPGDNYRLREESSKWASASASASSASVSSGTTLQFEASDQGSHGSLDDVNPNAIILEMRQARELLGLEGFPAEDLMETLGERAMAGSLSYNDWLESVHLMKQLAGSSDTGMLASMTLARKLFDLFQPKLRFGAASVEFVPFVVGLTALCSSPPEDKFSVAFTLLDSDGDGWISSQELRLLLSSFMAITAACSSIAAAKLSAAGVSIDVLAAAAVAEAERHAKTANGVSYRPGKFSLDQVADLAGDSVELCQVADF